MQMKKLEAWWVAAALSAREAAVGGADHAVLERRAAADSGEGPQQVVGAPDQARITVDRVNGVHFEAPDDRRWAERVAGDGDGDGDLGLVFFLP
jgi:hypothetical protein